MRLHYVSFFYYNFILFFCFILNIDLIFLLIVFLRKNHSIFKESLTEYIFQEFDGLKNDNQTLDLYEINFTLILDWILVWRKLICKVYTCIMPCMVLVWNSKLIMVILLLNETIRI